MITLSPVTLEGHADEVERYLAAALEGQAAGHMLPWVVRDLATNMIVGTTRESGGGRETEPGRASRATETAVADG